MQPTEINALPLWDLDLELQSILLGQLQGPLVVPNVMVSCASQSDGVDNVEVRAPCTPALPMPERTLYVAPSAFIAICQVIKALNASQHTLVSFGTHLTAVLLPD